MVDQRKLPQKVYQVFQFLDTHLNSWIEREGGTMEIQDFTRAFASECYTFDRFRKNGSYTWTANIH